MIIKTNIMFDLGPHLVSNLPNPIQTNQLLMFSLGPLTQQFTVWVDISDKQDGFFLGPHCYPWWWICDLTQPIAIPKWICCGPSYPVVYLTLNTIWANPIVMSIWSEWLKGEDESPIPSWLNWASWVKLAWLKGHWVKQVCLSVWAKKLGQTCRVTDSMPFQVMGQVTVDGLCHKLSKLDRYHYRWLGIKTDPQCPPRTRIENPIWVWIHFYLGLGLVNVRVDC